MSDKKESFVKTSLLEKIQSLKTSPQAYGEVKSALEEKYEHLCNKLHGLTIRPEKGRSTYGYGPLLNKFGLYIKHGNIPSSPNITMSDEKTLQFENSNGGLTLILKEENKDTNSEKIFLEEDSIFYFKKVEETNDSSEYNISNGDWERADQKKGRTSILSLDEIINKAILWIEEFDSFEKEIDSICIRNDDEVKNKFALQTKSLNDLTMSIHLKFLPNRFGGLGEKPQEFEVRNKKLVNEKTVTLTTDHAYISVESKDHETLQSGIDGSFIYFCASPSPDDYITQQRIVLDYNGNIDFSILKSGVESEKVTYKYKSVGTDPENKNYEIYRNLLNFLTTKRQECTRELQKALELRDADNYEGKNNVDDLKDKLLEE